MRGICLVLKINKKGHLQNEMVKLCNAKDPENPEYDDGKF